MKQFKPQESDVLKAYHKECRKANMYLAITLIFGCALIFCIIYNWDWILELWEQYDKL